MKKKLQNIITKILCLLLFIRVYCLFVFRQEADPSTPSLYRPIFLTSVLGKTPQKILNKSLYWYLEVNNLLLIRQYGFREGRNTFQALSDLRPQVNEAFSSNSYFYSVLIVSELTLVWKHLYQPKSLRFRLTWKSPEYSTKLLSWSTLNSPVSYTHLTLPTIYSV